MTGLTIYDLHEEYKHLFEKHEDGRIMRGIEVGEGWLVHVEDMLKSFEWHRVNNVPKNKTENNIQIFQIKEKFAQARVYWQCNNYSTENMLHEAVGRFEGKCSITCEVCGTLQYNCIRTGKNGWIRCICDKCANLSNIAK